MGLLKSRLSWTCRAHLCVASARTFDCPTAVPAASEPEFTRVEPVYLLGGASWGFAWV